MKITSIKKTKCFHVTYYEYKQRNGKYKQYFKLWNNGNFYGTFTSLHEAKVKAEFLRNYLYGFHSDSYIITNNGLSVSYYK